MPRMGLDRHRTSLGAAVVALAVVLAACGGGDGDAAPTNQSDATSSTTVTDSEATPSETTVPPGPPTIAELVASDGVLNIAHAGGDQDHPHSTLYAFSEAVEAGADVLEMDVRLTADGVVVVHHDEDTAKTSPEALVVRDTDFATLRALDNAHWFSAQCWPCQDRPVEEYEFRGVRTGDVAPPDGYGPDDFAIATLAEVAEAFPDLPLDVEIKGDGAAGIEVAEALAAELTRLDRLDSTVVVAFDSAVVTAFHQAAPTVATSPGVAELTSWILEGVPLADFHRVVQIPPAYSGVEVLTPETIALADAAGLPIWVWMDSPAEQENEEFYRSLVDMGVQGLLTGRPAAAERAAA